VTDIEKFERRFNSNGMSSLAFREGLKRAAMKRSSAVAGTGRAETRSRSEEIGCVDRE